MAIKMIARLFQKCLLSPKDLNPSREDLEVIGVFNPGATIVQDEVVLMARVAERVKERRQGNVALPRWDPERGVVIDWVSEDELDMLDPRVVQFKNSGLLRIALLSHLRVFRSRDGKSIDSVDDLRFMPQTNYKEFGVEDPRITRIDDDYYITYVSVSRHGAATALASTKDFQTFERHSVIFPPENKDVVLFPEKIYGEYLALHRPNPAHHFSPPEIWLARSRDLIRWGRHEVFQLAISD